MQLSLLADGCILAISLMHAVCDGMRCARAWRRLAGLAEGWLVGCSGAAPRKAGAAAPSTPRWCFHACTALRRWPHLAAHLAARYRRAAAQRGLGAPLPDNAAELLQPCGRRQLSSGGMAEQLLG